MRRETAIFVGGTASFVKPIISRQPLTGPVEVVFFKTVVAQREKKLRGHNGDRLHDGYGIHSASLSAVCLGKVRLTCHPRGRGLNNKCFGSCCCCCCSSFVSTCVLFSFVFCFCCYSSNSRYSPQERCCRCCRRPCN